MAKIKIGALGGLGENGKNMTIVEVDEHIFILDCGIKYPEIDMYGVDAVVPDMQYLVDNKDRIDGILLSHGHEDHIGALPYLLEKVKTPVFGTHFTICLVEETLIEKGMNLKKHRLYRINESKILTFGDVTVSFFNITHSIPEAVGISINTTDGSIIYITDFTFNFSNAYKYKTSYDKIIDLGRNGVLAVLPESLGTTNTDRSLNDSMLEYNFKKALMKPNRLIVSSFSSDLSRIQKIIDLSVTAGRRVAIVGRRAQRIIDIAISSGYLQIPTDKLVHLKLIDDEILNNDKDLVVIVTGIRQEPYSMITRMASKQDKLIRITPEDTVILMAPPVPGTEIFSTELLNFLYEKDIDVAIYNKTILKSSHAKEEDLKLLYQMLNPKFVIPIKGEYRHLYKHKDIALSSGFNEDLIPMLENGELLVIEDKEIKEIETINTGDVVIDGNFKNVNMSIIKEREQISAEGIILINVCVDTLAKQIVHGPVILNKGFVNQDSEIVNQALIELTTKIIENHFLKSVYNAEILKTGITTECSKLIFRYLKKRPTVLLNISEIRKVEKPKKEIKKETTKEENKMVEISLNDALKKYRKPKTKKQA